MTVEPLIDIGTPVGSLLTIGRSVVIPLAWTLIVTRSIALRPLAKKISLWSREGE